jgi:hypothetical protein
MHTSATHTPRFPFQSHLTLSATGRWGRGGYALVSDGDREEQVRLPRALFDVVALLLQEARRNATHPDSSHGFLSPEELLHRFERIPRQRGHAGLLDREHVIKYIYRIRKLLDDALPLLPGQAADAASGLLEFREFLGYRLSAPADRLHLKIIEDAPATAP